jgi:hypothetical protein
MESSITIKKIQSTSSNLHMHSHAMFQRGNKNCIDLEVIVLLLAEAVQLVLVIIADIVKIFKSEMKILVERQNPIHLPESNFVNKVPVLCCHVIENMDCYSNRITGISYVKL